MTTKVYDRVKKCLIASSEKNTEIKDILAENHINIDEYGNLRSLVGELMNFHYFNLVAVTEKAS